MNIERKLTEIGGSIALIIPSDIAKFLEISAGDEVIIKAEEKTKGKFVSFWKKG